MTRGRTDDVWVGGGEDVDVDDGPGKVGMNASERASVRVRVTARVSEIWGVESPSTGLEAALETWDLKQGELQRAFSALSSRS